MFRALTRVDTDKGICYYRGLDNKLHEFHTTLSTASKLNDWLYDKGPTLIQDAVPELTADERELMLSGLTPEEWDETFPEEEEI